MQNLKKADLFHKKAGANLGGIQGGLGHDQIFEIQILPTCLIHNQQPASYQAYQEIERVRKNHIIVYSNIYSGAKRARNGGCGWELDEKMKPLAENVIFALQKCD